jgi:hypothetical protein
MIDHEHGAYLLGLLAGLTAAIIVGIGLAWKQRTQPLFDRFALAILPASAYVVACTAFLNAWKAVENPWNGARLAPAVGLWYGERLYSGPSSGAVLNTIYPPMAFLPYVPAGLCSRPATAVFTASCISMTLVYGPFLALCLFPWTIRAGEGASVLLRVSIFLTFCTLVMTSSVLFAAAHGVHGDAPALGFAALACLALIAVHARERVPLFAALAAGICAGLAIGSKQTLIPLPCVLLCWVGLTRGWRSAAGFGIVLTGSLISVAALLVAVFGRSRMLFNIGTIPSQHPWKYQGGDSPMGLMYLAIELFLECLPMIVVILLVLMLRADDGIPGGMIHGRLRRWASSNPWALFAAAALGQVPFSLLGKVKVGGLVNSDAPPLYLLCAALAFLMLDRRCRRLRLGDGAISVVVLASFASPLALLPSHIFADLKSLRPWLEASDERAFAYAKAYPGAAYFPWNPLGSLLAEGRLSHFEYGLIDRDLAGLSVGPVQFRRHLPAGLRMVAFPPNPQSEWTLRALPEFRHRVKVAELPGWLCYER